MEDKKYKIRKGIAISERGLSIIKYRRDVKQEMVYTGVTSLFIVTGCELHIKEKIAADTHRRVSHSYPPVFSKKESVSVCVGLWLNSHFALLFSE